MLITLLARITLFGVKWSPWVQDDQFVDELVRVHNERKEKS